MKMKIVGICGSPRIKANTEIALSIALNEAKKQGIETEIILLADKTILPYYSNYKEQANKKDDAIEIFQKIIQADGIIIATPTYFANVSGLLKNLMDRTVSLRRDGIKLKNKIGGAIAIGASRNGGQEHACMAIVKFMLLHEMIVVSDKTTAHFGGIGIGSSSKTNAILDDEIGIKTIKNIGTKVAEIIKYGIKQ